MREVCSASRRRIETRQLTAPGKTSGKSPGIVGCRGFSLSDSVCLTAAAGSLAGQSDEAGGVPNNRRESRPGSPGPEAGRPAARVPRPERGSSSFGGARGRVQRRASSPASSCLRLPCALLLPCLRFLSGVEFAGEGEAADFTGAAAQADEAACRTVGGGSRRGQAPGGRRNRLRKSWNGAASVLPSVEEPERKPFRPGAVFRG